MDSQSPLYGSEQDELDDIRAIHAQIKRAHFMTSNPQYIDHRTTGTHAAEGIMDKSIFTELLIRVQQVMNPVRIAYTGELADVTVPGGTDFALSCFLLSSSPVDARPKPVRLVPFQNSFSSGLSSGRRPGGWLETGLILPSIQITPGTFSPNLSTEGAAQYMTAVIRRRS